MKFVRVLAAAAILLGLALSGILSYLHLILLKGQIAQGPLCDGLHAAVDCNAVIAGPHGFFLGIPLAFWGLAGYWAAAALWVAGSFRILRWGAAAALALDLYLGGVMLFQIQKVCLLCLGTYAVNLLIFFLAGRAAHAAPNPRFAPRWMAGLLLITGWIGIFSVYATARSFAAVPSEAVQEQVRRFFRERSGFRMDVTTAPARGTPDAPIQIVEFTDLLCPACRKAARFNEVILANYRGKVSLAIRHFPMDKACNPQVHQTLHPGACDWAAAAACLQEQGKFWEFHDRTFRKTKDFGSTELRQLLGDIGADLPAFDACMAAGRGKAVVQRDLEEARRLGVTATPSYFVNGLPVRGAITPEAFEKIAETILDNS